MNDPAYDLAAEEIARRPYARVVQQGEDGVYTSRVLEFPGVISEGDTPAEALEMVEDALRSVISVMLEHGDDIPDPWDDARYSGRFEVRVPPAVHARLAAHATLAGVSMNRVVSDALSRYVGMEQELGARKPAKQRRSA